MIFKTPIPLNLKSFHTKMVRAKFILIFSEISPILVRNFFTRKLLFELNDPRFLFLNTDPEYKKGSKFSMRTGQTDQLQVTDPRNGRAKTWRAEVLQKCKIHNEKLTVLYVFGNYCSNS